MNENFKYHFAAAIVLCAMAIVFFGISCKALPEDSLVLVDLWKTNPKTLEAVINTEVVTYEYKASTSFSNRNTVGEADWTEIDILGDEVSLGYFSQGIWTFELRGRNSDGTIVAYGSSTVKLSQVEESRIGIALSPIEGKGSLEVAVALDIEAYETATLSLWYKPYVGKAFGSKVETELTYDEESGLYKTTVSELESGNYLVGILYSGGEDDDSGEVLAIHIVNGVTTRILGVLENGMLYGEDLSIQSVRTLKGSISEKKEVSLKKEASALFQWKDEGKIPSIRYTWFLDDALLEDETDASFTYTQSDFRNHVVTCVSYGQEGEIASASCRVLFASLSWDYLESEERLPGVTYSFDGERLTIFQQDTQLGSIAQGEKLALPSLRANITFLRTGSTATIYNGETIIGSFLLH